MNAKGIIESIQSGFKNSDFEGFLIFGMRNIQYAAGLSLPFSFARKDLNTVLLWTKDGESVLFLPEVWADSLDHSCRVKDVRTYSAGKGNKNLISLIGDTLREISGCKKIGVDLDSISHSLYQDLAMELDSIELLANDSFFRKIREIKNEDEIELLKSLAMKADHAINGCLHHITVDRRRSELTLAEELRIHSLERGFESQGYNVCSQACCGDETKKFWPNSPKFGFSATRDLSSGDTIRVQMQNTIDGYWSSSARMMVNKDQLSEVQVKGYGFLNELRDLLLDMLKPGVSCSEVFKAVSKEAENRNIPLASELGLGHGIGISPFESPYLSEWDSTHIKEGMVLVIDPVVYADDGIYRSRDTVLISSSGATLLGWYKDWREPYTPIMSI